MSFTEKSELAERLTAAEDFLKAVRLLLIYEGYDVGALTQFLGIPKNESAEQPSRLSNHSNKTRQ